VRAQEISGKPVLQRQHADWLHALGNRRGSGGVASFHQHDQPVGKRRPRCGEGICSEGLAADLDTGAQMRRTLGIARDHRHRGRARQARGEVQAKGAGADDREGVACGRGVGGRGHVCSVRVHRVVGSARRGSVR